MNFNYPCPVCNSECRVIINDGKDYFILNGNSPTFGIVYCNNCEIGISVPPMTNEELSDYYPKDYEAYKPKKSFPAWLQTKKYRSDLKIIRKIVGKTNCSLFEIGSGRGEFLNEAKKKGFHVEGIEPSKSGVEYAKQNYGIILQQRYASDIIFKKKYHVIVIRHTLEHLNDFLGCLKNIYHNGIDDNGCMFIKVPRFDSQEFKLFGKLSSGLDLPRHRVHFTKLGIEKLLIKIGFNKIVIKSEIVPSDIIRSFLYYSKYGKKLFPKIFAVIFSRMPYLVKMIFAQIIGTLLSPFAAGRMIITARKS
ncbi:class I SAM-dependent methyltransferase [bacterium]|nr:class I SAM-dependent methyltransferase [bacterium]